MTPPKTVSLTAELNELRRALQAALLISESLDHDQLATEDEERQAPGAISAVLELAIVRLRDLGRAVNGRLDPELFWSEYNAADGKVSAGTRDVLLSSEERALHRQKRQSHRAS